MKIYPLSMDTIFKIVLKRKLNVITLMLDEFIGLKIKEDDIKFKETISEPNVINGKTIINDIKFEIPDGSVIFIEMQRQKHENILKRMEFYIAKLITENLKKGEDYEKLKKVYGIFFLRTDNKNFQKLFTKFDNYDTLDSVEGSFNWVVVNLDFVNKSTFSKDLTNLLKLMKTDDQEEMINLGKDNNLTEEVLEEMKRISADPLMQDALFTYEKEELDRINMNLQERKKSHAEGLSQGIAEGIEQNKINVIMNLKKSNLDLEFISKIVEMPVEKINTIIEEKK